MYETRTAFFAPYVTIADCVPPANIRAFAFSAAAAAFAAFFQAFFASFFVCLLDLA